MSLTILLEIGHDASLRSKISPEGFTHDWEIFVKGQNNADIHYYVEKVVFLLHETFPKPKRVVKEPPFSLRTSGYAGFKLPIEIYLKNNLEPKKIKFNYELYLQPPGPPIHIVQKEKYTFFNPSEEFRIKLLKGGAVEGSGNQENSVNRVVSEEKNQMTSKPKLSGSDFTKKHKMKFDEPRNTDFENLFGTPIKKSKLPEPPKPREPPPPPKPSNTEKSSDKEKSDKSKSNKSVHKDKEKEKPKEKSSDSSDKKNKEEKKKSKDEKNKDKERSKEKSSKKDKEREKSPPRPRSPTPKRSPKRESSPPPSQKHSSSKEKEPSKDEVKKDRDRDKEKKEDKKSKKEKRDHKEGKHKDREKDKEHREHKSKDRDRDKSSRDKESTSVKIESSPLPPAPVSSQTTHKTDKKLKEKEHSKEQLKEDEKVERVEKSEKVRPDSEDRQNKHKHKKKDRKEKKEEKHTKKEEKKTEKQPSSTLNSKDVFKESVSLPVNREIDKSSNLFGSPKSNSPPTPKEPEIKIENNPLFSRDDESSNDSVKMSSREASPVPRIPSKSPSPLPPPEPIKKLEPEKKKEQSPKKKDKKEKKKDKKIDKDHEKKKKRKSDSTIPLEAEPPEKIVKVQENNSDEESKVSSTEDTTAMIQPKSEYDMDMLRDLQHKIMSLKDNADLQRVVQLIAETGQYEVSAHTFDFDLCLLDRSTVRQLQDFFSTIS